MRLTVVWCRLVGLDEPIDTVLTEYHDALFQPFVVAVNHGDGGPASSNDRYRPVDEPANAPLQE